MDLPESVTRYLEDVLTRTQAVLGSDLIGAYVNGSIALSAFDPDRSDVDVVLVCHDHASRPLRASLVEAVRHAQLPCPARGLELVVYPSTFAAAGEPGAGFVLELNDGPAMPFRARFEADERGADDRFWYVIDRSTLCAVGERLAGPAASEVFGAPRDADVLDALRSSVRWHRQGDAGRNGVLNTCRALRWAEDGIWLSKTDAGVWWSRRHREPVVRDALSDRPLAHADIERFLDAALARLGVAT
jgi:hypothetical protein